ncbi:MAG TPA: hypothetical protein PLO53_11925, partial [Candidatus Hydrogenedentes bacterium]|nr:hypothetical protein [Candidatus Hydrogenedentota bacterium]
MSHSTSKPMFKIDMATMKRPVKVLASRQDTRDTYEWGSRATVEDVFEVLSLELTEPAESRTRWWSGTGPP